MEILEAVLLGIIQGLTEFLPISSSGHLSLASMLGFSNNEEQLAMFVVLHMGTLGAVIWGMRREIRDVCTKSRNMIAPIAASTIITGIIGLLLKKVIENSISSGIIVGTGFIITTVLLITGEIIFKRTQSPSEEISVKKGLLIGFLQGIAAIPGISRSGSTIAAGLFAGLTKEKAVAYSFLISIPAVTGAFLLEAADIMNLKGIIAPIAGFISAFISGYAALLLLFRIVKSRYYAVFGVYTFILGITVLIYGLKHGH